MKKVTVIGTFFHGQPVSDGQSVKTKILTEELERAFGADQVARIDTIGWKKHPISLLFKSISAVWGSKNVIFLTDENGTKVFPFLLRFVNIAGRCKIHYYVVGGWLSNYLDRSKCGTRYLQKLDAVYVEVPAMLRELESRGFKNVVLVNKFRRLTSVDGCDLNLNPTPPYKLCFFSRIMREKGIEEAIAAVKLANERAGFVKYTLDIFGSIHSGYQEIFNELMRNFPEYIKYRGIVDFQKSSDVLKLYFTLLFPTFYNSEGYPNAVVDAFAAGLPIIATRWNYNADIIHDREDGILVDIKSPSALSDALEYLADNKQLYSQMRLNCLSRCAEYQPESAITKVIERMN